MLLEVGYRPSPSPASSELIRCQALAIMTQPENVWTSIAELARLSDEIWYLAGNPSTDTSWYTKRAGLSTIYASTG